MTTTIKTDFIDGHFLSPKELRLVDEWWPTDGWKDAVIYHRQREREEYHPESRHGLKCHEKRKNVLNGIRELMMPKMIRWASREGDIEHVWFRYTHVDWLHYREGMFFKEHQDFENYICQGLIPCVGLLGLSNVTRGGETRVETTMMRGSAVRNGYAFFQGNVPHEAMRVMEGEKKCLKMEFFVLRKTSPSTRVMVWDENRRWRSYWGSKELSMMENFLGSLVDFKKSSASASSSSSSSSSPPPSSTTMVVTLATDTTQKLHNMMMGISDPRSVKKLLTQEEVDFFFPSFTLPCLHDLFAASSVLHGNGSNNIFMGTDASAWEFLNRTETMGSKYRLVVGLWIRETDVDTEEKSYRLDSIADRLGVVHPVQPIQKNAKDVIIAPTDSFLNWDTLRSRAIEEFIASHDGSSCEPQQERPTEAKKGWSCQGFRLDLKGLKMVKPSDEMLRPNRWVLRKTESHYEMCNDEDMGGEWEHYEVYRSFEMQVRWCVIGV
uniref:Uncharacterized protein n=1 Tax=viral metagenome TaxID=1070528 RepID=A0A6C0K486_9ZZZZ